MTNYTHMGLPKSVSTGRDFHDASDLVILEGSELLTLRIFELNFDCVSQRCGRAPRATLLFYASGSFLL